jgi:hypothetical protein
MTYLNLVLLDDHRCMGCNTVYARRSLDFLPPSSESTFNPSKKPVENELAACLRGLLIYLLSDHEDEGDKFIRKFGYNPAPQSLLLH